MKGWAETFAEEHRVANAHRRDESFHGILCDHALIMLEALHKKHASKEDAIRIGLDLAQVQFNWIALLCQEGRFRTHVVQLVGRFSRLLLALVKDDETCTFAELTESPELQAMSTLHTRNGYLTLQTLERFRDYVASLCRLYAAEFDAPPLHSTKEARCRVLYDAEALGRWLDYVKAQ